MIIVRRIVLALLALLVALSFAMAGFYLWLTGHAGRDFLARRIEGVYADKVAGTLEIGSIDRLRGATVDVSNVRFLDPRAREVIRVDRAHVKLEVLAILFGGELRLTDARATGARVTITRGQRLSTSIAEAFGRRGEKSGDPIDIDTGFIEIDRTAMILSMGGPRVRFGGLNGSLRVVRYGTDPARVSIRGFAGTISVPDIEILRTRRFTAAGEILPKTSRVLDLRARACLDLGEIPIHITFAPRRLKMRFDPSDNRLAGLALGAAGISEMIETERGRVNMRGVRRC